MLYSLCKRIYHNLPVSIQEKISVQLALRWMKNYINEQSKEEPLVRDMFHFIQENQFSENIIVRYPYEWTLKYQIDDIDVFHEGGFPYVKYKGRKLFGKQSFSKFEAKCYFRLLFMEQDEASPHRYLKQGRYPSDDSVVADIGAAEGIFTIDCLDFAKEIYLFEGDEAWVEALYRTFSHEFNKVHIIPRYVGTGKDNTVRLDDYIHKGINYLKADIEGHEHEMFLGGDVLFSSDFLRQVLLCCYHRSKDAENVPLFLAKHNYAMQMNEGFIFSFSEGCTKHANCLRRGVVYGEKKRQ